jgi:hypothetical protein
MTARPDHDLFDRDAFGLPTSGGAVPDTILVGLAKLSGGPPLWGSEIEWLELVNRMRAWSCRWHGPAFQPNAAPMPEFSSNPPRRRCFACRPTLPLRRNRRRRCHQGPPTMAVLPSADSETEMPWKPFPTPPVPTSLSPCCANCANASYDERSRAAKIRIDAPNDLDDPSEIGQPRRGVIIEDFRFVP